MKRLAIACALIVSVILIVVSYRTIFFSFDRLEEGTYYKGPFESPEGKYTADSYYKTYGGAAGGVKIWVEVTNEENKESQIVYYGSGKSNFDVKWEGEHTIFIKNNEGPAFPEADSSIALEVGEEVYDGSGRACDSWVMKEDYDQCYERG
jgi:hypothetical protein